MYQDLSGYHSRIFQDYVLGFRFCQDIVKIKPTKILIIINTNSVLEFLYIIECLLPLDRRNVNKDVFLITLYSETYIKALPLFSNVLYGWCPKCRQTHKTMYSRVEG